MYSIVSIDNIISIFNADRRRPYARDGASGIRHTEQEVTDPEPGKAAGCMFAIREIYDHIPAVNRKTVV